MRIGDWSSDVCSSDLFALDYLKISPNNKFPAIVDADGPGGQPLSLFESGAILIYLAEKSGRLLPQAARARLEALQWLMCQMGGFGPMLGQAHHLPRFAKEQLPYAIDRYTTEARRLHGRSEEHTSEPPPPMRNSYDLLRLRDKKKNRLKVHAL